MSTDPNKTGRVLTVSGVYLYGVASITPGLDCINGISGGSNSITQTLTCTTPIPQYQSFPS